MRIHDILRERLERIYSGDSERILLTAGTLLEPELGKITDSFYTELLDIPEIAPILENSIVQKNLANSLHIWMSDLFRPHSGQQIQTMIDRQKHVGAVHARININLNYVTHGITILKREIFRVLQEKLEIGKDLVEAILVMGLLFDVLAAIISEAYFSNEMLHETNELSLRMKGMTQNAALECERLRSALLDWLRGTLNFLYQTPEINLDNLPRLRYSTFGLWVIYKSDLLYEVLNMAPELKRHIHEIDECLFAAAKYRNNEGRFFKSVSDLNEAVTRTSWFISSIVDRAIELDTGTDTLTRLFNRRYLETILRRQTNISIKLGLQHSVMIVDIDRFKEINDLYGHESGDAFLKQFAEMLLFSVRACDFVFRYGGEEFLVVLGNVGHEEASAIAEKIRGKCETHIFKVPGNKDLRKTCSIGIAVYSGHPDYRRLVRDADMALYEAKQGGRNRVVFRG